MIVEASNTHSSISESRLWSQQSAALRRPRAVKLLAWKPCSSPISLQKANLFSIMQNFIHCPNKNCAHLCPKIKLRKKIRFYVYSVKYNKHGVFTHSAFYGAHLICLDVCSPIGCSGLNDGPLVTSSLTFCLFKDTGWFN